MKRQESCYAKSAWSLPELEHAYGENVHLLADPYLFTLLARLCSPKSVQPEFNRLIETCFAGLLRAFICAELPRAALVEPTRMQASEEDAVVVGEGIAEATRVVTVNIARAGAVPSQLAFELLHQVLLPAGIRQDHLIMNRVTDDAGQVTGVDVSGSKIGGDVEGAIVVFPDPMAATGGSLSRALSIYKDEVEGTPKKLVALHLIVTPEYIKRITTDHPDVPIYALRLDRGLSAPELLSTQLGERWSEERGLDEHQYIVPGGGGFGELINNAER